MFANMMSILKMLFNGGFMMIPIVICSIIALAIIIERIRFLKKSYIDKEAFMIKIKDVLKRGEIENAIYLCANTNGALSNVLLSGIKAKKQSKEEIFEAINEASMEEIPKMETNLPVLATITKISPLLGLLGTVVGMIIAFEKISSVGVGNPTVLADGIAQALITTAAGLFVAIPSLVFYNYITEKIDIYIHEIEKSSIELVKILVDNNENNLNKQEIEK